jgi:CHAT domain-containing protein
MVDFYAALERGQSPAAALRTAQLAMRSADSHPWLWASFVVAGAG